MNGRLPDPAKAFLGVGWAFPPRLELDQHISLVAYEQDIEQAIRIILGTNRGERVMRPDFGAGLAEFAFEPANTSTAELLRKRVEEALVDWEPRIDVQEVTVTIDLNERNRLDIDVSYRVRATNTLHNLVYPFYLQEGTKQ